MAVLVSVGVRPLALVFPVHQITERGGGAGYRRLVRLVAARIVPRLLPGTGAFAGRVIGFVSAGTRTQAEADLFFLDVDLDDLEVVFQTLLERGVAIDRIAGFGDVAKTLDALGNFNERAELRGAQNLAVDHVAHAVRGEEALPDIGLQLLDAQREAAILRLNAENHGLDLFSLLHDFRGMLDALGPAQVRDMDEAVDAIFDFDEGAEVGEIAHAAFDDCAHGIFFDQAFPGIL